MGSFVSYPSVFYFFIWLFWLKNPKVDAWFFSLPWGKPKGWRFFAWFGSCLLWLDEKLFFMGSFQNYSFAFSFSVCLVWPKNPKGLAWLFSLLRGKPKGRSFLAWFGSSLLGLAEKWFLGSFQDYPSAFWFFICLFLSPLISGFFSKLFFCIYFRSLTAMKF